MSSITIRTNAVRINEYSYSLLHSELEETAKILAGALEPSVSAPDKGTIQLDHGLVLTVAENLIGNAARFAKSKIEIHLERKGNFLHLSVTDDGPGYPVELIQSGPKPFGKMKEDSAHFGMGLYSSQILCLKHGGTLTLGKQQKLWCNGYCFFPNKSETLSVFLRFLFYTLLIL